MKKEKILGFDVCVVTIDKLLENIFNDYDNEEQLFIVNINPEIAVRNYSNQKIKDIFNKQKYQLPDGEGIVWASKKNHGNIKTRIAGIDLMTKICKMAPQKSAKIFLYGSKENIANKAKIELEKKCDGINIVGTANGYENQEDVIKKIQSTKPDIIFVGLGSPKQEEFIINNKEKLRSVKIFMPVGGSFDVISNSKKRAPKFFIKIRLEWLYRLFQEPRRIIRQTKLIKFIYLVRRKK